jgi:protein-tyrosine phosphatase
VTVVDHHLVSGGPAPLYMGALPSRWDQIPARVVVNLCGMMPYGAATLGRAVHLLTMLDVPEAELLPDRAALESFLDAAHAHAAREATYWHCHAGLNRSGFAVAAYLHRHRGARIGEAIAGLRQVRSPLVLCNPTFERTLRTWYGGPDEQSFEPVDPALLRLLEPL